MIRIRGPLETFRAAFHGESPLREDGNPEAPEEAVEPCELPPPDS